MRELKTFMSANSHQVLSVGEAKASLNAILEQVSRYHDRVIITAGNSEPTVLISLAPIVEVNLPIIDFAGWAQLLSSCGKESSPQYPALGAGLTQVSCVYRKVSAWVWVRL